MSIALRLEEIGKCYTPSTPVLKDITFTVRAGECLALVGPSGCGKTTLLRVIAGLDQPTTGRILLDGKIVNDVPCHKREVAMLFQRPALIAQHTVRRSLSWAWTLGQPWRYLAGHNVSADLELVRVAQLLDLEKVLDRPIQQLSGGQQQRVALGRCLLRKAKLLLLDEPLGQLDAPLRTDLRRQIRTLIKETRATTIHVTHDPEEAFSVGDRIAVMQKGVIVQIDEPTKLRRFPANQFVTELIHHHTGGMNFLAGDIRRDDMDTHFESVLGRWPMPVQIVEKLRESLCQGENFHAGEGKVHIIMGVAVEDVRCSTASGSAEDEVCLTMPVQTIESGDETNGIIAVNSSCCWVGKSNLDERLESGQGVTMRFSMNRAYWFDPTSGRTLAAAI